MPTYNGWNIVAYPALTVVPAPRSIEAKDEYIAGVVTNPFTGQQQTHDWQARWKEASISYGALTQAQAAPLIAFLLSLNGTTSVFQFPAALAAGYPEILTSDGAAQFYWRLKANSVSFGAAKPGKVYTNITFEIRQAT